MRKFPLGFLVGILLAQKVSCFPCAESHRKIRKLSIKTRVNSGDAWFPPLETVSTLGNPKFPQGFLWGFQ